MYSYNTLFGIVGQAVGVAFAYAAFFPTTGQYNPGLLNPHGYFEVSSVFGVCIVIAIAVCVFGTWREIPYLPASGRSSARCSLLGVFSQTAEAFRNRSFRALFFGLSLSTIVASAEAVLITECELRRHRR